MLRSSKGARSLTLERLSPSRRRPSAAELRIPIKHFPTDNAKLAEMEFYLLEDLDFHLVVFHPYRSLTAICGREPMDTGWFDPPGSAADDGAADDDLKLGRGTGQGAVRFDKEIFETAWCVVGLALDRLSTLRRRAR